MSDHGEVVPSGRHEVGEEDTQLLGDHVVGQHDPVGQKVLLVLHHEVQDGTAVVGPALQVNGGTGRITLNQGVE